MITFSGVTKRFGRARVLDGLAFDAHPGQVTLLVGANGSGKTTSLRLLAGLSRPDAGQVRIAGADIARESDEALARLSFLPQSPRFHARLTAGEILRFYARLRGLDADRVDEVEARWNLAEVRDQPTGRLSGGTRQRLALAVLALPEAPVLVLDEPGLSLDPDWRRFLHAELHGAAQRGATVLVATHLLGEWDGKADRCLVLERGRISRELPPSRLREAFPFAPVLAQVG
ncbi:multidrug ABC transporter ATP-binding protein [Luteitalea sp. TBR-22]|uniref:heme ABC exporter ATP-binding protein CcmA n=1 Tax=Luteitalea sp. TBR-22 TaxID=2802971 RepID=UPI001AF81A84|nr:heme ABC exporter ATP-binding protein CcmA [Luteitalea sp. TBR-22]BCS32349.1 multidrug ABC transporter ATP-binding protein [Luteitalea sp. TBR-22]